MKKLKNTLKILLNDEGWLDAIGVLVLALDVVLIFILFSLLM